MADTLPLERLPIKVVLPNQGDRRRVPGGGSPRKPFRDVDHEFRASLANQVMAIRSGLARPLTTVGVAPLRVKLTPKAYAKSHRPRALFSNWTCPIVGAGQLGELFVKATYDGLSRLQETIEVNETQYMVKQLSTVQSIEAVTPAFRRKRRARQMFSAPPRGLTMSSFSHGYACSTSVGLRRITSKATFGTFVAIATSVFPAQAIRLTSRPSPSHVERLRTWGPCHASLESARSSGCLCSEPSGARRPILWIYQTTCPLLTESKASTLSWPSLTAASMIPWLLSTAGLPADVQP